MQWTIYLYIARDLSFVKVMRLTRNRLRGADSFYPKTRAE
jgi:hypothetical protein